MTTPFDATIATPTHEVWADGGQAGDAATIEVPEDYNVDFRTGAGNVDIEDLYGSVDGRTGAGNVFIGEIDGPALWL